MPEAKVNISDRVYQKLKDDIFDFLLLPGERFSETEIANRMQASRTPVREALHRLEREGFVLPNFRSRWQVRPFDIRYYEELYDLRVVLECESLNRLCEQAALADALAGLLATWCCDERERVHDGMKVAEMDEAFHFELVKLAGNHQMAAMHRDVCERLRIIRRLDFTKQYRIEVTYTEHSEFLHQLVQKQLEQAKISLRKHIEASRDNVCTITTQRIKMAQLRFKTRKALV